MFSSGRTALITRLSFIRLLSSTVPAPNEAFSSFKTASKGLASQEEIQDLQKKERRKSVVAHNDQKVTRNNQNAGNISSFARVTVTKKRRHAELFVKEPLTFANYLDSSSFASRDQAEQAGDFLDHAAEVHEENLSKGKEDSINWDAAMEIIQESESRFPEPFEDRVKIMEHKAVAPTFNLATHVNDSPTLQRLVDLGTRIADWERSGHIETAFLIDFSRDVAPR